MKLKIKPHGDDKALVTSGNFETVYPGNIKMVCSHTVVDYKDVELCLGHQTATKIHTGDPEISVEITEAVNRAIEDDEKSIIEIPE